MSGLYDGNTDDADSDDDRCNEHVPGHLEGRAGLEDAGERGPETNGVGLVCQRRVSSLTEYIHKIHIVHIKNNSSLDTV